MGASGGKPERVHALDGLRAIAVSLVLTHHLITGSLAVSQAGQPWAYWTTLLGSFTASGVELFFVLSAIVLVRPYASGQAQLDKVKYVQRRFERLWPPFLAAWLLAGLVVYLATRFPTWWTSTSTLPAFRLDSWLPQVLIVYFGRESYNFAWWSLTVEVMFYLVVPLLIPVVKWAMAGQGQRMNALYAWALALSLGVSLLRHQGWLSGLHGSLSALLLFASCFAAGLYLAGKGRGLPGGLWWAAVGAAWVLLANAWGGLNIHIGWGLVYFAVIGHILGQPGAAREALSQPLMVWLGERSYALFLTHYSVIVLVCHVMSMVYEGKSASYFLASRVISLVLSLLVAILVFHWVERRYARNLMTAHLMFPPLTWRMVVGRSAAALEK